MEASHGQGSSSVRRACCTRRRCMSCSSTTLAIFRLRASTTPSRLCRTLPRPALRSLHAHVTVASVALWSVWWRPSGHCSNGKVPPHTHVLFNAGCIISYPRIGTAATKLRAMHVKQQLVSELLWYKRRYKLHVGLYLQVTPPGVADASLVRVLRASI